jgi:hypothetical protein
MPSKRMSSRRWVGLGLLALALALCGCLPLPPISRPIANAGPDQTVSTGQVVTLDGSRSTDPDGDPLTFSWRQTAGAPVTLSGATTLMPQFAAPSVAGLLTFLLTVNDGHGGFAADSVQIHVTTASTTPSALYVAGYSGNNVVSFSNAAALNGNVIPTTDLTGGLTRLFSPTAVVIDGAGELIVSNQASRAITVYSDANSADGNIAPVRQVTGLSTLLLSPVAMAIDTVRDLLYVADNATTPRILVFGGVSTASFNNNVAPAHALTSTAFGSPVGVFLDGANNLYVANFGRSNVLVFSGASTLNGQVTPTRTLTNPSFSAIHDVFVDGRNNLFVLVTGSVLVFGSASTINGPVAPSSSLTIVGVQDVRAIAVDPAGTGYIADRFAAAVYVYDNISTRNGALAPDRTIQGSNTQLFGPNGLFLSTR